MRYVRGGVAMCHNVGIAMVEGMMKPEQSLLVDGCGDAGMRNGEIGRVHEGESERVNAGPSHMASNASWTLVN